LSRYQLAERLPRIRSSYRRNIIKVLIDNDDIRVVEFHIPPGQKEPMPSHSHGFVYALEDAQLRISFPDGRTEEISVKAGEARWRDKITHAVENIGTTEARTLAVELKK